MSLKCILANCLQITLSIQTGDSGRDRERAGGPRGAAQRLLSDRLPEEGEGVPLQALQEELRQAQHAQETPGMTIGDALDTVKCIYHLAIQFGILTRIFQMITHTYSGTSGCSQNPNL